MSTEKQIVNLIRFETPLGEMLACASQQGICLLEFLDGKMLTHELSNIAKRLTATVEISTNPLFDQLQNELHEYFDGKRKEFSVPLHFVGTDFQKRVWSELLNIPFGVTRSYKQQALALGNLAAIRAVAGANGMNKIAIVVPCHRVIGDGGQLVGYSGGLWRKQRLLKIEGANASNRPAAIQRILFDG